MNSNATYQTCEWYNQAWDDGVARTLNICRRISSSNGTWKNGEPHPTIALLPDTPKDEVVGFLKTPTNFGCVLHKPKETETAKETY